MTYRELFREVMFYGSFDHMPVIHWRGWEETRERWFSEGMPKDVSPHTFFDAVPQWTGVGANLSLFPAFEQETIEETPDYRIFRDGAGVIQQDWKGKSCIPHYLDFTLKTPADWPEFKRRLQPDAGRLPRNLDQHIADAAASGLPITVGTASLMGWLRNWMGVEHMSYLMCDHPDCYTDMVMTLADLTCWAIDEVVPRMQAQGVTPDMGFGWEDICHRTGPLVSPRIFDACVAPGYRKIRDRLESYGITLYGIDTDGNVAPMLRNWLEAGVNVQFPIEVGAWKADAMVFRRQYGKELRIVGHFDKLTLERSQKAVQAEIERLKPLMRDGGYIMMPDHLITPGVSLDMYRWYLDQVRALRL